MRSLSPVAHEWRAEASETIMERKIELVLCTGCETVVNRVEFIEEEPYCAECFDEAVGRAELRAEEYKERYK